MTGEHEGQGGSYNINEAGVRELIERTRGPDEAPAPGAPEAAPTEQPAEAGFFTPVAPADQPTTE